MDQIQQYAKAITAVVAPIIIALLLKVFMTLGIQMTTDVQNAVVVVLTGFLVWLIPNIEKKK